MCLTKAMEEANSEPHSFFHWAPMTDTITVPYCNTQSDVSDQASIGLNGVPHDMADLQKITKIFRMTSQEKSFCEFAIDFFAELAVLASWTKIQFALLRQVMIEPITSLARGGGESKG